MKFIAEYRHRKGGQPPYWRTVWADSVNEAIRQADKWAKHGFLCVGVKTDGA